MAKSSFNTGLTWFQTSTSAAVDLSACFTFDHDEKRAADSKRAAAQLRAAESKEQQ